MIFLLGGLLLLASSALAADARLLANLRRLDPSLRLEQICDLEAMNQLSHRGFDADRAKSNVSVSPIHNGDILIANGAAFRSRGNWYHLSFVCVGTSDHLHVKSFRYTIGRMIPQSKWSSLDLWR